MMIFMIKTIHESVNGGRTAQEFLKDQRYEIPNATAKRWIAQHWAEPAVPAKPEKE